MQFLPISGLLGLNMKERVPTTVCDWWDGPCLFEALDSVELPERNPKGPFRYLCFFFFGMYCWIVFVQFFPLDMTFFFLSQCGFFPFFHVFSVHIQLAYTFSGSQLHDKYAHL